MFAEVAAGVYSVATGFVDGLNTIVFGSRIALAVDVGYAPEVGQATADFICGQGYQSNRVALTHGHSDHVLGGQAFAEAEVYAHAATPSEMRRQLTAFATRKKLSPDKLLAQALWPTVTYRDELVIDLGGKHVHFFSTPGHSPDGVSAYVVEDRVLVAGDSVVNGIVPAIFDDSRRLEDSLRALQALDIEALIPGHGTVIQGSTAVQDWIGWLVDYVSGVRAFVSEALATEPPVDADALADRLSYERFIGDRLPVDRHGMPQRHRNTVLKIIAEVQAEAKAI